MYFEKIRNFIILSFIILNSTIALPTHAGLNNRLTRSTDALPRCPDGQYVEDIGWNGRCINCPARATCDGRDVKCNDPGQLFYVIDYECRNVPVTN